MGRDRYEIDIRFETHQRPVSKKWLHRTAKQILKVLGWEKAALSLVLVSDSRIRGFNRKYFKHDRPTDVIAFSQLEGRPLPKVSLPLLGDVMISVDTVKRQAPQYGNSFRDECALYLCHGILHLMGYDDGTKVGSRRMEMKQNKILKKILEGSRKNAKSRAKKR
ncbi:MAG: rRNA maturation RNase YbeY [Candidatus Omnitrophica bacterium]|nr:rRNA maturation RNase YbeY [Candidatus Omnitrophota bacterium]